MNNPDNQTEQPVEPILLEDDTSEDDDDDVWQVPDLSEKDLETLAEEFFGEACKPIDDPVWKDLPLSQG
jgi:hypothetical protein